MATQSGDITGFIEYAVQGFRDGLFMILDQIQKDQLMITWNNYIYGIFEEQNAIGKSIQANKRRRELLLQMPFEEGLKPNEIKNLNTFIVKLYFGLSERIFYSDLEFLVKIGLLEKEKNTYRAKLETLVQYMPGKIN